MINIQSIKEIITLIAEVRNKRKGFITNFYLDEFKHNLWIQKGDFFYDIIGETVFLIRDSQTFCNLFYNSTSIEVLSDDLQSFRSRYPEKIAMIDILGRFTQCEPLVNMLKRQGLFEATSLVRMSRITEKTEYTADESVVFADSTEVRQVESMLHHFFNEKNEQIPYFEELEKFANDNKILVCHVDGKLAGFVIYEMNSTTLYLRYWFTHPDFRDNKVGSRLLRRLFEEGKDTKRQLFWVIRSNENAIKRYHHYGFKEEDMFDYVFRIN